MDHGDEMLLYCRENEEDVAPVDDDEPNSVDQCVTTC